MTDWPFSLVDQDRNRLREELLRLARVGDDVAAGVFPAVNLYDDGESFMLRAEIPGLDKERLDVSVRGDQLTLRGERIVERPEERANYHRRERESGQFRRVVTLPHRVEAGGVTATYRDGVLEVVLPRVAEAQPRKVQIS